MAGRPKNIVVTLGDDQNGRHWLWDYRRRHGDKTLRRARMKLRPLPRLKKEGSTP